MYRTQDISGKKINGMGYLEQISWDMKLGWGIYLGQN